MAAPTSLRGLYDVAVRYGSGPIDWADRDNDPSIQKTLAFVPWHASPQSVAVITDTGRRAFRPGEPIALHLVRGTRVAVPTRVRLDLTLGDAALASVQLEVGRDYAGEVPAALTRRLTPGRYRLVPSAAGHESYPLAIDIAPDAPDSPLQRLLYHEFTQGATTRQPHLADTAERLAFIRDSAHAVAALGFTRETDRRVGHLARKDGPHGWRRDRLPAGVAAPGLPPADSFALPTPDSDWEAEYYLDQAVRFGLRYDSQLLGHCSGVRFREPWLRELVPVLQRSCPVVRPLSLVLRLQLQRRDVLRRF